jgi:anti-sigma B factor antagonist
MDETCTISEASEEGRAVVSVIGEVDVDSAPALRERLDQVIDRKAPLLVVDLLGVSFVDSTALGVLIGAFKKCRRDGLIMRLAVVDPRILKIFEITELTDLFPIYPSVDDAVRG